MVHLVAICDRCTIAVQTQNDRVALYDCDLCRCMACREMLMIDTDDRRLCVHCYEKERAGA